MAAGSISVSGGSATAPSPIRAAVTGTINPYVIAFLICLVLLAGCLDRDRRGGGGPRRNR
jgi:hypothetical protein